MMPRSFTSDFSNSWLPVWSVFSLRLTVGVNAYIYPGR